MENKKVVIIGSHIDLQNLKPEQINALQALTNKYKYNFLADESHALKATGTQRQSNLDKILNYSKLDLMILASATPITVEAEDLANQVKLMFGFRSLKKDINPESFYGKLKKEFDDIIEIKDQIEQIKALRLFLIKNRALVSQRELPASLNLPTINEKNPQIVIDLETPSGIKAMLKMIRMGFLSGSSTDLHRIMAMVKMSPESFGLEYEAGSQSFEESVLEAKENGEKVVVYTHATDNNDIVMKIQDELLKMRILPEEITLFTAEDSQNRFSNLQKFLNNDFGVLIATRVLGGSVDGLQGKPGVPGSSISKFWVLNSPTTHAASEQLDGRFKRPNGEENTKIDKVVPEVVIKYGNLVVCLEKIMEQIIDYRGGMLQALIGQTPEFQAPPDIESLVSYFQSWTHRALTEIYSQNEDPFISSSSQDFSPEVSMQNGEVQHVKQMHKLFGSSKTDLSKLNPKAWQEYHEIRKKHEQNWTTIPREFIAKYLFKFLTDSPKDKIPQILELGCGKNPILNELKPKNWIELEFSQIKYFANDLFKDFQEPLTGEELKKQINQLKLDHLKANTPLEKNNIAKIINELKYIQQNPQTASPLNLNFRDGDYRKTITTFESNSLDIIMASLSFYTWDQDSQLELFEEMADKLKVGGQIILVIPKRILEAESENSNLENPQTKAEQLAENLQNVGLESKTTTKGQKTYSFDQAKGFETLPGGQFVAVTFGKTHKSRK